VAGSYNLEVNGGDVTSYMRLGDTNLDSYAVASSGLQHAGIVMQSSHYLNNIIDQNYDLLTLDYKATVKAKRHHYVAGSDTRFTTGSIHRKIEGGVTTKANDRTVISLGHVIDVDGGYTQKNDKGVFFFSRLFRNCENFEGKTSASVNFMIGGPFMEITKGTGSKTSHVLAVSFNIGSGNMAANTDYVLTMGAASSLFKYGLSFLFANDTENKTYLGFGMSKIEIKAGVLIYKKQDGSGSQTLHNEAANLHILIGVLSKITHEKIMGMGAAVINLIASASKESDSRLSTSLADLNT